MPEIELTRSPDDRKKFVLEGFGDVRKSGFMGLGRSATLTARDGRSWEADRKGLRQRPVISDPAGGEPASFEAAGTFKRGGRLVVGPDTYELGPSSGWRQRYSLSRGEQELATLEGGNGWTGKTPVQVEVTDGAEIDALVLLTACWLVEQFANDAAAGAGATAGGAGAT